MIQKDRSGWRRIWDAAGFSIKGFRAAWRNEAAFRQEVYLASILVPAAFWIGTTMIQRALLIFSVMLILVVELLNSALETTVDRIGQEPHEMSGQAKDLGSAAVMASFLTAAMVWFLVIWEVALVDS